MAKALLLAHVHPTDHAHEEEFNRWYDEVHLPQVVSAVDGIVGGSRYRYSDTQLLPPEAAPAHSYITVYELDTDDIATAIEQLKAAQTDASDAINVSNVPPLLHFYTATDAQ